MSDQSSAAVALLAATAMQEVGLEGGDGGGDIAGVASPDMTQVLSGLQTATGTLGTVLHTQTPVFSEGGSTTPPPPKFCMYVHTLHTHTHTQSWV